NYQVLYQRHPAGTQQQAWSDCEKILRSQFLSLTQSRPDSQSWTLIFEYELPGEGGRRPDLVLLAAGQILVFEFKQKAALSTADLDQVAAYRRDLAEYHQRSTQNPVTAILIPTRYTKENAVRNEVQILNPAQISTYLETLTETQPEIDSNLWVNAEYAPLPTVIEAARRIFQQEPLPSIRRAQSAKIPEILDYLNQIVDRASEQKERHLVLMTGVPGAGKTLVGLQFVYQTESNHRAIFLSGNRPLISVLQYALQSKAFVREIRNFYLQHEARRQSAPREHIVVFDEAQRAWDIDRMSEKYGISSAAPGAVLRICERVPDWCVLLGLIGEGQTIHIGEEGGIEQWNQGLKTAIEPWQLHCSTEQSAHFEINAHTNDVLNLTTSLRSHLAKDVQTWVACVLNGEVDQARSIMPSLILEGFNCYITRDLEIVKKYCRDRYSEQADKRYGLVASSRSRNLVKYEIRNDYISTQKLNVGAWYIDPPDSDASCCQFDRVVTEFSCQGLELDFPIIGWGDDLIWRDRAWVTTTRQKNARDPLQLRLNSYRVLLTRGRDGLIIFVPPEAKMDSTFEILQTVGLQSLT
ncbi:MAG TPA: DNA/RNA helicase domain-containing protein, partial [Leptolyngbya sp.]|nr:DNA/RNA helicase domain-containing protein [Leptolyngbya sp.]